MFTLLILLVVMFIVFVVAFISPRHGTSAQQHSENLLGTIKSAIRSWPKFLKKLVELPPVVSQKGIHKSAEAGKKSRAKVSRDSTQA